MNHHSTRRHATVLAATALLAIALLPSCMLTSGTTGFDPLEEASNSPSEEKLRFYSIESRGKISRADLRPDNRVFRVGPGDLLEIEIVEIPLTKALTAVMPDGMLYYDAVDPVSAAGKTIAEVENALAEGLREYYSSPIVNINLKKIQSRTFTVLGQVKKPAVYEMGQPTNVLDAIAAAGGTYSSFFGGKTQELADLRRSILVRNKKIVPVDFEALIENGDMSQNIYLRPGDYIYLPAAGTEKIYIMGAVRFPTAVDYSSRVTLVSALAAAKGMLPNAYQPGALLIRGSVAKPRVARLNLRDLTKGRQPNFRLEPGDIIWVPRGPWEKLKEYALIAVDSAVTAIAVRETAKWFAEDIVEDRIDSNDDDNSSSNATPELTISTGPETVESPPAPVVTAPVVIEPAESRGAIGNDALSSAFGGS